MCHATISQMKYEGVELVARRLCIYFQLFEPTDEQIQGAIDRIESQHRLVSLKELDESNSVIHCANDTVSFLRQLNQSLRDRVMKHEPELALPKLDDWRDKHVVVDKEDWKMALSTILTLKEKMKLMNPGPNATNLIVGAENFLDRFKGTDQ